MGQRRKFTAEYKREAVAMLDARGVTVAKSPQTWASARMSWDGGDVSYARHPSRPLWATGDPAMKSEPAPSRVGPGDEGAGVFARSGSVLRESVDMKFRMIQRCRDVFPIRLMCRCLRVSASGYYGWATRAPSARTQENVRFLTRIRQLHTEADGVIGSPRIWEDLRYAGERCGRHRVARLMRRAGLHGVPQRRRWRTKPSGSTVRLEPATIWSGTSRRRRPTPNGSPISPTCGRPNTGCTCVSCWICIRAWWWAGR